MTLNIWWGACALWFVYVAVALPLCGGGAHAQVLQSAPKPVAAPAGGPPMTGAAVATGKINPVMAEQQGADAAAKASQQKIDSQR